MNNPSGARRATRSNLSAHGVRAISVTLIITLLAGCAGNPLAWEEGDYGRDVSLDRLRQLEPANFEKYARHDVKVPTDMSGMIEKQAIEKARKRFEGIENYAVGLEEARASTLSNNLQLQIALVDPAIARETVSQEEARFESAFTLRTLWDERNTPTGLSNPDRSFSGTRLIEPGVRVPLRTGETVNVNFAAQRNNANPGGILNPNYNDDLSFSVSQPLLRNAGRRANTAALRIASYNQKAAESTTKLEAIRQIAAVDRSYWRLYQAKKSLGVTQQQYELAQAQLERAERRVRSGSAPEIEVIRSQAGVADRLDAIIRAQNAVLTQQRELKRVMNMPGLTIETQTMLTLATEPDLVLYEFDRVALTEQAVNTRMEMLELELRLAADAANIDLAQNRALPLITLDYTYNVNGLGGVRGKAVEGIAEWQNTDWSIGLNAEIPLGNEAARSAVRRAILTRVQRLSTKDAREQSIRQEVLNAIDTSEAAWQRVIAARQSVILNTRALQAEQRQFDVGASTSTNVLDAATRLAEAQLQEINAITDYEISQVDLAFATGTLLGQSRVDLTIPDRPNLDQPAPKEEIRGEGEAKHVPGPALLELFGKKVADDAKAKNAESAPKPDPQTPPPAGQPQTPPSPEPQKETTPQ
ncbi:MAG: TolC family protein [Phycisphaerales bacterium]|nr:TolC family protein [Phycisphaerales bacterium]